MAAEAAMMEMMSVGTSGFADITVTTTWVSLTKPEGKSGRSGRSIRREIKVSPSVARPSRRKKLTGILPAA